KRRKRHQETGCYQQNEEGAGAISFPSDHIFFRTISSFCFFTIWSKKARKVSYSSGINVARLHIILELIWIILFCWPTRYWNTQEPALSRFITSCLGISSTWYPSGMYIEKVIVFSNPKGISTGY